MRVPNFQQQVNEAQVPSVQLRGGLTPGEAVNVASNQFGGLVEMVNAGGQAYSQYQEEADRVRVMDAENQLLTLKNHLQTNQTDGFYNKKGADVVGFDDGQGSGFVDYYSKAYQDGVNQINEKLGNNNQRKLFSQITAKDSVAFRNTLQNYLIRENDTYQQSVYTASAERYVKNINDNPNDFNSIDENRLNLRAAFNRVAQLQGRSALEAENNYLGAISQTHVANINSFIESNDLRGAVQYRNKYSDEISLSDSFKANKWIDQKIEEKQVENLVNFASNGVDAYSNPALNIPPQSARQAVSELRNLTPEQMKNIKYNDQRLDIYTVHTAREKGMEWAAPLLLGLRLSGEKSNNDQVSPKGARSVMQFMPATWSDHNKNGERDLNNPADTIDAAFEFVDWVSKKYKTKDPMVIAAYYNGGGKAAEAVIKGNQPPKVETRNYLQRIDKWLTSDFGKYAEEPAKSRQQAFDAVWNSNASPEVKGKAQTVLNQKFAAMDKVKSDQQDQVYGNLYKGIISGQMTYEQIPVNAFDALEPNQIDSLKSVSKATYEKAVKTDPTVYSMIMLNKDELFKGKPQSVVHQYADKLSPSDYRAVTQMYIDVNKPKSIEGSDKDKKFLANDSTIATALKPYLNIIGITDTKNKEQLLHYNAVKSDLMQTMLEAEARNGGHLTWDQINRLTLKNINNNVKITTTSPFFADKVEQNRVYSQVKKKADITPTMLQKLDNLFKKQGRNTDNVTDAEYLNAYYAMMRRGF
ncbi:transglycosylase SLT domain-containing protein [Acinetobacter modestus]|uniref:transglycosylase SLT domain-containing protein n=1 Tax=Acinetobacter modestus TaxID=1776740 RepID=UPI001F4BAA39|nr:transglycosylase SLT domain-containing protein [Acinetobacter modestus]MCH7333485.1 transglycosylase SLT domain-containing protein [Acinetobacter modestus]